MRLLGRNELSRPGRHSSLTLLAGNFTHLLALLLWIAALLAFVGSLPELGWAIIAVIVINGVFSFAQEYRASRLVEAIQRQVRQPCRVRRNGQLFAVDSAVLVPGDVVLLSEGDRVPADCRVVTSFGLEIDESALTGESAPVLKGSGIAEPGSDMTLPNLLYAGTLVVQGDSEALVWATGDRTQFGAISALTASLEEAAGPLRQEIEDLARTTAVVAVIAGLVIWGVSTVVLRREFGEGFVFAIGVLVALVPEGLLPTLSLSLALGVQRMARRNVLVRRLSAVEAVGATQVICTDKTGTLTQNRMVVERIWLEGREYLVEDGTDLAEYGAEAPEPVQDLLNTAVLASNASAVMSESGESIFAGDPTEVAIVRLADALKLTRKARRKEELPFDSFRRMMSSVDEDDEGTAVHVKGAPDAVLERSAYGSQGQILDAGAHELIVAQAEAYAASGLRVLAVARRRLAGGPPEGGSVESQLEFLGLLAMIDPIRPQAAQTVARCREAGIRVLIVTGDHPGTAAEIARRTGIASTAQPRVITGAELERLTPAALRAALSEDVVFARTTPSQKLTIVAALQEMDLVVAVVGDGVNDAPSLRKADVGVAMGKGGTDVAREAADIVLLDDNLATIVDAVEEGRAIFANIKKFVTYVFTSNVAELAPFAAFVLTGVPLPLKILQVLAVDLGTDLIPALALGAEPPEPGLLKEGPRPKGAPVLDRGVFWRIFLVLGPIEAALGLAGFFFTYWSEGWRPGEPLAGSGQLYVLATTMTFAGIVVGQMGNALACRSARTSLFAMPLARNPLLIAALTIELLTLLLITHVPPFQNFFDFTAPGVSEWLFLLLLMPVLPMLDEIRKKLSGRRTEPNCVRGS